MGFGWEKAHLLNQLTDYFLQAGYFAYVKIIKTISSQKNPRVCGIIIFMKIPITQSREWQKLQEYLGETSFFEKTDEYQFLAILKTTKAGKYLHLPYGPVAKDKTTLKKALNALTSLARENHAIFIRIEPQLPELKEYLTKTYKRVKEIDPADTWVLDLSPDEATIVSNFSQGTRTRYNTYQKKGLSVEVTREKSEISHLVTLQNKLYKKKNLTAFSRKYLEAELAQPFASLYLVKYHHPDVSADGASGASDVQSTPNLPEDGQVIAASLFFDYEDTRYYMQSAADGDFKKLPATVALLTKAIFDAKEKGIKYFDFWGIAPDGADSTHPWYGFTEFKKSFGGAEVHYAGTYDIVINKFKYRLFNLIKKLAGK